MQLTPAARIHGQLVASWFRDAEGSGRLPFRAFNFSTQQEENYLENNFVADYHLFMCAGVEIAQQYVGIGGLHSFSTNSARTLVVVDSALRNRGYGSLIRGRILRYAFEVLGLEIVRSSTLACNSFATRLVYRTGGVFRDSTIARVNGVLHNLNNFDQSDFVVGDEGIKSEPDCICGRSS